MFNRQGYVVVGKFSEVSLDDLIIKKDNTFTIDKKKLRMVVAAGLSITLLFLLSDASFAAEASSSFLDINQPAEAAMAAVQRQPTQLQHIFEYIRWLVQLLRLIVSSVAGLICTFAGYKWATTVDGNGAETAKKILKNAFIGGLLVFAGTSIADFFVGKMEDILA